MDLAPKNFSSLNKDVIENGSGTHSEFFEAAFKLGRIRPSKPGKNFAKACEDFSHPENRVYFPFANIDYDNIV